MPHMDSIGYKTNELLTYYCGCHGNLVTIAMRYVADAYCPYQIWTQYNLRQRSYKKNVFDSDSLTHSTHKSGQLDFTECRVTTLQAR